MQEVEDSSSKHMVRGREWWKGSAGCDVVCCVWRGGEVFFIFLRSVRTTWASEVVVGLG